MLFSLNLWLAISCITNIFGSERSWILYFFDLKILVKVIKYITWLFHALSPIRTWRTWNSSVALLSLTCLCYVLVEYLYTGLWLIQLKYKSKTSPLKDILSTVLRVYQYHVRCISKFFKNILQSSSVYHVLKYLKLLSTWNKCISRMFEKVLYPLSRFDNLFT